MKTKGKPNEIDIEIGINLKRIRQSKNMSRNELALWIDVSYQQIQKYENALNRISASRLALFADIFDVPITSFYPKKYRIISEHFLKRLLNDME